MNQKVPVILASGSPRRQSLLKELGLTFIVVLKPVDEEFPQELKREKVATFLAEKKRNVYHQEIASGAVVITADTIVCVDDIILNKPSDIEEAAAMLRLLSGRSHEVITGVCISGMNQTNCFSVSTTVYFKTLSESEINYYITTCKPFDKAGGYGIQEWIGLVGLEKLDGSYYNVVGLPVKEVYEHLISMGVIENP